MRLLSFPLLLLAIVSLSCGAAASLHAQGSGAALANAVALASASPAAPGVVPTVAPLPGTGGEQGIIKLDVLLTDKAGNPVSGLKQTDFTVTDNGQPSRILAFHGFNGNMVKANPAVEVILFLDSIKVSGRVAEIDRQEVEQFLRQNGGHLSHPTSVYGVSDRGQWQLKKPSANGNELADELVHGKGVSWVDTQAGTLRNGLPMRNGMMNDPLDSAAFIRHYGVNGALEAVTQIATAARRRPGRKLLLWIGRGCCTGSGSHLPGLTSDDERKKVFDMAYWTSTLFREAHLALYSFSEGTEDPEMSQSYEASLNGPKAPADTSWMSIYKKVLAIQSGGRVLTPSSLLDGPANKLLNQINDVVREADVFYMLSIDASPASYPEEYHELKVEVDHPDLLVRTRSGYFDEPYYVDAPNPLLKRMTVAQIDAILKEDRGDRDAELAKQLSYIELTERMSSARLRNWTMVFRGKKTRAALTALSDASAFLDPPQDDVLHDTPPDATEQRKMLALAAGYLDMTMPTLPNFFAARMTVRYEDTPEAHERGMKIDFRPLHVADTAKATVRFRNGDEVVEEQHPKREEYTSADHSQVAHGSLVTHGTFGPLLGFISKALAVPGSITWSRWERGLDGRRVVFHWTVPQTKSTFSIGGCCLPDGDGTMSFSKMSGYSGEIAIDPDSGAILRLQLKTDLSSNDPPMTTPAVRSGIVIEYGNIEVGGIPYICPIRSVTMSRVRSVIDLIEGDQTFKTYGPYWTLLNDVTFDNYHRFRSDARMITDLPADE